MTLGIDLITSLTANFSNILTTSANTQTTGITILPASGNINTGVFKLYGVL